MWVNNAVRWMKSIDWQNCAFPVNPERLKNRVCYGGLDLSSTDDITAFVLVFPPENMDDEDDKFQVLPYFWIPEEQHKARVKRKNSVYAEFVKLGLMQTTSGNAVNYSYIEKTIIELNSKYKIKEVAFDRWGANI